MDEVSNHQKHDQQAASGNSSNPMNPGGAAIAETVIVVRSEEDVRDSAEDGDSKFEVNVLETRKLSAEEQKASVSEPDRHARASENSSNPGGAAVAEAVIVVRSEEDASINAEDRDSKSEVNVLEKSKVFAGEQKASVSEPDKHTCAIDIKYTCGALSSENWDSEKICRICHLSSEQSSDMSDLIHLGCGCKDELGFAHRYCAETWFRLKGNRSCEICGETAKNITAVGDIRSMEEWNGRRHAASTTNPSRRGRGCWQGQPFCNFLMACLVIAFMLPWFFRVNLF